MKPHHTPATKSASNRFTQRQWLLTVIGILTAIASSLVLLNANAPNQRFDKESNHANAFAPTGIHHFVAGKAATGLSILAVFQWSKQ